MRAALFSCLLLLLLLSTVCGSNSSSDITQEYRDLKIETAANCNGRLLLNVSWNDDTCEKSHYEVNHTSGDKSNLKNEMVWSSTQPFILIATSDTDGLDMQHCVQVRCNGTETWSQKACTLDPPKERYVACEKNHELQLKCMNESAHLSYGSSVIWRHNGTEVSDGVDNSGNSSVLRIPNSTWTDSGEYSCVSETDGTIRSYTVIIGIPPKGSSLECHCHDYTVLTCTWSLPETNLLTNARCDYTRSENERAVDSQDFELCQSSIGEHRFYLPEHPAARLYLIEILTQNALGKVYDPQERALPFRILEDSVPYPPVFELNVTRKSPTEQHLQISWNYFLPEESVPFPDMRWLVNITYKNAVKEEIHLVEDDTGKTSKQYDLPFGNVEYCVKIMTKPVPMKREGNWSKERCIDAPPNRPNVRVVPSCQAKSTEDCVYHPTDDESRRSVTISWKVKPLKERDLEPPQGVTGFNLSIMRLAGDGAQDRDTILQNLTETDAMYLYNSTFSQEIPDLLVSESYLVYLSAFNSAGSSDSEQVEISPMAPTVVPENEVPVHVVSIVSVTVILVVLLLLIVSVAACTIQCLKRNSRHIPDPSVPQEIQVIPQTRREPEVFDTLRCDTPQDVLVSGETEGSHLLNSSNEPSSSVKYFEVGYDEEDTLGYNSTECPSHYVKNNTYCNDEHV